MKKTLLRILLVICGLNVFTSCYGLPPEDWPEPTPVPEEEDKDTAQPADGPDVSSSALPCAADTAAVADIILPK